MFKLTGILPITMKKRLMFLVISHTLARMQKLALIPLMLISASFPVQGQTLDDSLGVVSATNKDAAQSQRKIDDLSRDTRILLEEYRSLKESVEYQQAYTRELEQLDASQQAQIERSVFERVEGDWFYMDGTIVKQKPVVRDKPKVGRNQPCPCGSGKKYKKCHGRN